MQRCEGEKMGDKKMKKCPLLELAETEVSKKPDDIEG